MLLIAGSYHVSATLLLDVGRQHCTLAGSGIRLPFQFLIALHKISIGDDDSFADLLRARAGLATGLLTLRAKGIA